MHVPALQMYVIKLQSNSYLADLMCAREQREDFLYKRTQEPLQ